jgi:Cu/Ag efflux pump CusA
MAARRRTINPRPQSTTSTRSTCNREAAGLALVPLALGGGRAGSEIQTPMAIVILCGLTTSTLLNMAVVPTLYLRLGRSRESRLA